MPLTFFGATDGPNTGFRQHQIIGKFPIGSEAFGSVSGAGGTVYHRDPTLGTIMVDSGSDKFVANEVVVDTLTQAPECALTCRIVYSPAYMAPMRIQTADGKPVDVDFSEDFRGRGPEDGDEAGGVFGDTTNPDVFADTSPYEIITYREHLEGLNDKLSSIKVLQPSVVSQVSSLFRKALRQ